MLQSLARRLPFYYGWLCVAVVFVSMAIAVNARTAFSLLYPPILDEFGWDRAVTAGVFSFGFLVSAVMSPIAGRAMDAKGPQVVCVLGALFTGCGLLLATVTQAPWQLYLTLGALVGAGSVILGYSGQALWLPAWFVRRRGFALSVAFAGVGVGSILLLPLLQSTIERAGWRAACIGLGTAALLLLVPLNLLLRRRPEDLGLRPDGEAAPLPGAGPAHGANVVDAAWAATDWTLGRALRTARFWWLALGYFSGLFAWYLVQVHQTKYLIETGFSATEAALALGAVSLAGVPGQIALGQLSDRIGREPVWAIGSAGFVLTYVLLLVLPAWPGMPLLWAMVLLQGGLGYGVTSVFGAIPAELFEGKHYGSIFGCLSLASIAGGALGPFVGGAVHDATGSYAAAFWIAIGGSLLSVVAVYRAAPGKVRAVAGRLPAAGAQGQSALTARGR